MVLKSLKFVETLKEAETFVQHGHVMVGNQVVRDTDFLVPRRMEDHISWNDNSKIKKRIEEFQDQLDDYDFHS